MNREPNAHSKATARPSMLLSLTLFALLALPALAQEQQQTEFDKDSLALRTALHYDPSLKAPLERLLAQYRNANRVDDLFTLYRSHLAQYPTDDHSTIVLIRLLSETGEREALKLAGTAVQSFPENAYLRYLHAGLLKRGSAPGWLAELDKAIELEKLPGRKIAWIDEILPAAMLEDQRDLASKHLTTLAGMATTPEARLEVARKMSQYRFYQPALDLLTRTDGPQPAPETMVELQLEAATAEVGLNKNQAAAARLDQLLSKLTADYWRRPDIVKRRLLLITSRDEQQQMIDAAKAELQKKPRDEAAVLDLAQMMTTFGFHRDALETLQKAGQSLPESQPLETQILALYDRLRDERGRADYLTARLKQQPKRTDLELQLIRTLFLLERGEEGMMQYQELAKKLPAGEQVEAGLELARFLRKSTLVSSAAKLFEQTLALEPARLDVLRELAETYIQLGDQYRVRQLFTQSLPANAPLENLLDLVQFMIKQELYVEARAALRSRLDSEKTNVELRTLLLSVESKLGAASAGEQLIDETRALADTGARYRLWLEAAVAFHEEFDTANEFLREEQTRLEQAAGWDKTQLERVLAFADVAPRSYSYKDVPNLLQARLQQQLPAEDLVALRKGLVKILESDRQLAPQVLEQLQLLARDDPAALPEYQARLAVLHSRQEREDLAQGILATLELNEVNDPALLDQLLPLYARMPDSVRKSLLITERLTQLNPTNRANWEQWLTLLAGTGDEARLRQSVRRLLAGIENMTLDDATRGTLEGHLADSYWRSLAKLLADADQVDYIAALELVDSVERMAQDDQSWLWVTYIRAHILNQLGRLPARDAALQELDRIARRVPLAKELPPSGPPQQTGLNDPNGNPATIPLLFPPPPKPAESQPFSEPMILFPDGLTVSLSHAKRLLTQPPQTAEPAVPSGRRGPLPEFQVDWVFDLPKDAVVVGLTALDKDRLLIRDRGSRLYCINATTGKVLWEQTEPVVSRSGDALVFWPEPVSDGQGRFFLSLGGLAECYSSETGELLWRVETFPSGSVRKIDPDAQPASRFFVHDGGLLVFDPTHLQLMRVEIATGKVLWEKRLPMPDGGTAHYANSGASLSGDSLLIYGRLTAILDARTGEIGWSFDPAGVRPFPISLNEPREENTETYGEVEPGAEGNPGRTARGFSPSLPGGEQQSVFISYLEDGEQMLSSLLNNNLARTTKLALAGPAVQWAAGLRNGNLNGEGMLAGNWLLLYDHSQLTILPTAFPLPAKRVPVTGRWIGVSGRVACFENAGALILVNLINGNTRRYQTQQVAGPDQLVFARIDGPLVYLTGSRGIACVNAYSGTRLFEQEWSKDLLPKRELFTQVIADGLGFDQMVQNMQQATPMIYNRMGTYPVLQSGQPYNSTVYLSGSQAIQWNPPPNVSFLVPQQPAYPTLGRGLSPVQFQQPGQPGAMPAQLENVFRSQLMYTTNAPSLLQVEDNRLYMLLGLNRVASLSGQRSEPGSE